jgi:glycosyltransferase involved in cell wall biosynthesis
MPTTLLIVTDTLPPDPNGVALIAVRTTALLGQDRDVHLFGPQGVRLPGRIRQTSVPRGPLGTDDCRLAWGGFCAVARAVRQSQHVVVHTLGPLGIAALFLARWHDRESTLFLHNELPQLVKHTIGPSVHQGWITRGAACLEQWAAAHATRVVSPASHAVAGHEVLQLAPPRFQGPPELPRTDDRLTIAYHGRVSREKALDATIHAIAQADPGKRRLGLRLIGGGSELESTLGLARSLAVPVEHVPWCPLPLQHVAPADVYVTASRTETYSIATLEAMGCGIPVVARRVGEIPHYVRHGETGLLFDRDEELAPLLARLADDGALRRKLAAGARASARDRSIWAQFAIASVGA